MLTAALLLNSAFAANSPNNPNSGRNFETRDPFINYRDTEVSLGLKGGVDGPTPEAQQKEGTPLGFRVSTDLCLGTSMGGYHDRLGLTVNANVCIGRDWTTEAGKALHLGPEAGMGLDWRLTSNINIGPRFGFQGDIASGLPSTATAEELLGTKHRTGLDSSGWYGGVAAELPGKRGEWELELRVHKNGGFEQEQIGGSLVLRKPLIRVEGNY